MILPALIPTLPGAGCWVAWIYFTPYLANLPVPGPLGPYHHDVSLAGLQGLVWKDAGARQIGTPQSVLVRSAHTSHAH